MRAAFVVIGLTLVLACAILIGEQPGMGQVSTAGASPNAAKTTEQVFKNIQTLKGVPADQLIPTMEFISASLGVGCDFCHVEGQFEKDDKKPKDVARKMMTMMFAINKDNFDGHRVVTCNSCHGGSVKPAATPIISDEAAKATMAAAPEAKPDLSKLPPPSDLLDKYLQAAGGAAAIEKISSRVEKGTVTGFGGRKFPVEIFDKAGASAMVTHYGNAGDGVTVFDGHEGWSAFPRRPAREMGQADLDAAKMDADTHLPADLKKMFSEFKTAVPEKIAGSETYQILGLRAGQPAIEFYFDQQSGLLVRVVRYAETALGLYPTQIDYADYRDQDGVKIPFRTITASPGRSTTLQIEQIQHDVPIDDAKFAKPAPPPEKK